MYLTKLMNKNSQQVKPEPEQQRNSPKRNIRGNEKSRAGATVGKDRYADSGCAQRCQNLCTAFLDFAAQCSPERIENLLLFHADAPEATWMKTFDEWKEAGRSVRSGEAGYTALIGQDYTREDGTAASGYYVGKKFDVSQTRGRQPDKAPVYAADELVTAFFENSPVRIIVSEELPDGVQAQYVAKTGRFLCATICLRKLRFWQSPVSRQPRALISMTASTVEMHIRRKATARHMWRLRSMVWMSGAFLLSVCVSCVRAGAAGTAPFFERRKTGGIRCGAYCSPRTAGDGAIRNAGGGLFGRAESRCEGERPAQTGKSKKGASRSGSKPIVFRLFSNMQWIFPERCGSVEMNTEEGEALMVAKERLYRMTEPDKNMLFCCAGR